MFTNSKLTALGAFVAGGVLVGAAIFGASSLASAGGASAAGLKIKCTSMTGNISGTITLTGCTPGATGGSSIPMPAATLLATGGSINWVNGKNTTVTLASSTTETDTDKAGGSCPRGTTEYETKGRVTADTTGSAPVGGKASSEACVNATTGAVSIEPLSALKLK